MPRHVYANPKCPEVIHTKDILALTIYYIILQICPILALGMYILCFPKIENDKRLFVGGRQYDRYRKIMARFLKAHMEELLSRG